MRSIALGTGRHLINTIEDAGERGLLRHGAPIKSAARTTQSGAIRISPPSSTQPHSRPCYGLANEATNELGGLAAKRPADLAIITWLVALYYANYYRKSRANSNSGYP